MDMVVLFAKQNKLVYVKVPASYNSPQETVRHIYVL